MADGDGDKKKSGGGLKKAWKVTKTILSMGAIGTVATLGGTILLPFVGASAAGAAATGATNAGILTSFWSPLVTDPVSGSMGLTEGFNRIVSGFGEFGEAALEVIKSGLNPADGLSPMAAMKETLALPATG